MLKRTYLPVGNASLNDLHEHLHRLLMELSVRLRDVPVELGATLNEDCQVLWVRLEKAGVRQPRGPQGVEGPLAPANRFSELRPAASGPRRTPTRTVPP